MTAGNNLSSSKPRIDIEILTVAVKPRLGGMTTWLHQVAQGLSDLGWKVRFVAVTDRIEGYENVPFEVVHLPILPPDKDRFPLVDKWRRWNQVSSLWETMGLSRPRIRISDGTPGILNFARNLHDTSSIPWVVLTGGNVFQETRSNALSIFLHRRIRSALNQANLVLVDGEDLKTSLQSQGIGKENVQVQYQGVDISAFHQPISPTHFFPERSADPSLRLVWHGRLAVHHGPERFLHIAQQVETSIGRFAGGGDPSPNLKRKLEDPSFQDWFLGCLSQQDLIGLLHEADCGVYPLEKMAGIPTVLLESMATGLPVVTLRTGACQALIEDGKNGFILDSVAEMVGCIDRLRKDPDLRSQICDSARNTIHEVWSTQATTQSLERKLEQVLDQ